jgi:hypothetical protein
MTADRSALKRQHDHFQPLKMTIQLYHITHIRNLDSILRSGGLVSTARRLRESIQHAPPTHIFKIAEQGYRSLARWAAISIFSS